MRVVFFGTPAFAVPSLAALLDAGIDVAAVVTQPDRPVNRSHSTLAPPPVKQHALTAGIAVWQPDRPRGDRFHQLLREAHADLIVVVAYGHLLRPELLAIPRLGAVNVHASLLPRWRGAAPIQWALLAGDTDTGVSIMRIEAGLDTGAVWDTRHVPITDRDTTGTLLVTLADLGASALVDALPRIANGEAPMPQADVAATVAPKIDRAVARIRWDEPAPVVSRQIRAMDPAPGAWTRIGPAEIKLFGARQVPALEPRAAPGSIRGHDGRLSMATADGAVTVAEVQPAGKRRMPAAEWLRGANLPTDARFE